MAPRPFTVLLVCRANLCRSPLMEILLRVESQHRGLDWSVSSAGVEARAGAPMHSSARRLLLSRGLEVDEWRTRELDADMVRDADLILTAEAAHRSAVAALVSSSTTRTFTLLQFSRLVAALPPSRRQTQPADFGPWLVDEARAIRPHVQPGPRGNSDLADPIGRSYRAFQSCAGKVDRALEGILRPGPEPEWQWLRPTDEAARV